MPLHILAQLPVKAIFNNNLIWYNNYTLIK